jgi:hypothetical protein
MKKAFVVLLLAMASSGVAAAPAMAGSSTDAALALGAFAVFNQFLTGQTIFQHGFSSRPVIVQPPPTVIYAPPPPPPPVVYAPPPVVVYPTGYTYVIPQHAYPTYPYRCDRRHHRDDDDD